MASSPVVVDLNPQVKSQIEAVAGSAVALASAYFIDSPEMADMAAEDLRKLATEYKRVEEMRFGITRPLDTAKANAIAAFKPYLERIDAATKILKDKVNAYLTAERERVERERREEEARRAEEEARIAKQRAQAEAAADAAAEAGDEAAFEQAAAAVEEAEQEALTSAIAPTAVAAAHKTSGVAQRKAWKVSEINLLELVQAAAKNPDLLIYLQPDAVKINKVVTALGDQSKIPGVKAELQYSVSARRF